VSSGGITSGGSAATSRIQFVRVTSPDALNTWLFELLEQHYRQGLRQVLLCRDRAACDRYDDLLWTFREEVFLPHMVVDPSDNPVDNRILLTSTIVGEAFDVAILLADPDYTGLSGCTRIYEVIAQWNAAHVEEKRQRFRHCQDLGWSPGFQDYRHGERQD